MQIGFFFFFANGALKKKTIYIYFRAVLGLQQNWAEGMEVSIYPISPTILDSFPDLNGPQWMNSCWPTIIIRSP